MSGPLVLNFSNISFWKKSYKLAACIIIITHNIWLEHLQFYIYDFFSFPNNALFTSLSFSLIEYQVCTLALFLMSLKFNKENAYLTDMPLGGQYDELTSV